MLFHRTQAAAAQAIEKDDPEAALDALQDGLERMRAFFATHGAEEEFEENAMVQQLRKMDRSVREHHKIENTLQEQLLVAVLKEDYEAAAELRDQIRRRQQ